LVSKQKEDKQKGLRDKCRNVMADRLVKKQKETLESMSMVNIILAPFVNIVRKRNLQGKEGIISKQRRLILRKKGINGKGNI